MTLLISSRSLQQFYKLEYWIKSEDSFFLCGHKKKNNPEKIPKQITQSQKETDLLMPFFTSIISNISKEPQW